MEEASPIGSIAAIDSIHSERRTRKLAIELRSSGIKGQTGEIVQAARVAV